MSLRNTKGTYPQRKNKDIALISTQSIPVQYTINMKQLNHTQLPSHQEKRHIKCNAPKGKLTPNAVHLAWEGQRLMSHNRS